MMRPATRQVLPHSAGYSMIEVLVAMAIFAIGFIAVASIFPVAAILQKETVRSVYEQQGIRAAEAALGGRGLKKADLMASPGLAGWDTDQVVHALPSSLMTASATAETKWLLVDRSYPSTVASTVGREIYWIPLVRDPYDPTDATPADVQVFIFILQRDQNTAYNIPVVATPANNTDTTAVPQVCRMTVALDNSDASRFMLANSGLKTGDQILDEYGHIYTVATADSAGFQINGIIVPCSDPGTASGRMPLAIWYAPAPSADKSSPTRAIRTVVGAVK